MRGILTTGAPKALPWWKRIMDVLLGGMTALLLAPVAALVAVAVKLTSPGPVVFRQQRIGYLGRPFILLKFRTMKAGADPDMHARHLKALIKSNAPLRKMDEMGDSRLAPLGWLMRVSGLDELPQLINVLKGEMSLVGPRPCMDYECRELTPDQKRRFLALPGITGPWQTCGRNGMTFQDMIRLDLAYVDGKSWWGDLRIMARTPWAIVCQVARAMRREPTAESAPVPGEARGMTPATVLEASDGDKWRV